MSTKSIKSRLLMKRDIEANWLKAENFIPLPGEIIIYAADENHEKPRIKIGDGEAKVNELPFATLDIPDIPQTTTVYEETLITEYMTNVWVTSGLIPLVVGNKYQVTIEDKTFSAVAVSGQWDADTPIAVLGNGSLFVSDMEDTGEPYCVLAAFSPVDVGGASLYGAVVIDDTVWPDKESVYLKVEEGSPNHLMLITNENGEMVWEEKLCYDERTIVVPETSFTEADTTNDEIIINTAFTIEEGKTYIVSYNGKDYECISLIGSLGDINGDSIDDPIGFLGNVSVINDSIEDNGMPFLIMSTQEIPVEGPDEEQSVYGQFVPLDGATSGSFAVTTGSIKKLDSKFIDVPVPESDWNANEGEVGYIKNRTHYEAAYIEYLPETEIELVELGGGLYVTQTTIPVGKTKEIKADQTYTITYDGVNYNYKFLEFEGGVFAGNVDLLMNQSNGEPIAIGFLPIENDDQNCDLLFVDVNATASKTAKVKVSNEETRAVKLDKKFMPDGLFYMEHEDSVPVMEKTAFNSVLEANATLLLPLEKDRTYIVTINDDKEYETKCKEITVEDDIYYCLGDMSVIGGEDTDEPFNITTIKNSTDANIVLHGDGLQSTTTTMSIRTAEINSKIPSQHLPTPNWSAIKGEEGYIENRTHWYIPGFTAEWDGVTDGKETGTLSNNVDSFTIYKFSDRYITLEQIEYGSFKIVNSSTGHENTLPSAIFETANSKNFGFWVGDGYMFSCAEKGALIFQSASSSVSTNSMNIQVPSSGLYLFDPELTMPAFNLNVLEAIKRLDAKYIGNAINIISTDYEALVNNKERVENPDYYCNLTGFELRNLFKEGAIGEINLYYTNGVDDNVGYATVIETFNINAIWNSENNVPGIYLRTATVNGKYANIRIDEGDHDAYVTWYEDTPPLELDTTLTQSGKAADAKVVGDAIPSNLVNGASQGSLRTIGVPAGNAIGLYAFAEGAFTTASGRESHAEGSNSIASGDSSHAEGQGTTARGRCSHSEGIHTVANGYYSHAGGNNSRAMGLTSFARGHEININRAYSTSIGKYNLDPDSTENTLETNLNTRIGVYKAQSFETTYIEPVISLEDGTVIAESTTSLTPESFLPDMYVISPYANDPGYWKILSTPELDGNYYSANVDSYKIKLSSEQLSTYAFSVGNGTAESRSNAHTLDWDGTAWYQSDVYVGGSGQDDAAAKRLVAAPLTASVGQTIVIKAVDEKGRPTEWEAVDIVTELPSVTVDDAGKFLRVQSNGTYALETLQTEEWTFTLDDGTEVIKNVVVL